MITSSGSPTADRRRHQVVHSREDVRIIRQRGGERGSTRGLRRDAARDQSGGRDQHARARNFGKSSVAEPSHAYPELHQPLGGGGIHSTLTHDDLPFHIRGWKVEVYHHEPLPSARLQVLEGVLITGVVRSDNLKPGRRLDDLATLLDREQSAVVGERMDHDHDVLPRLDNLIQVAERSMSRGERECPILPDRLATTDEKPTGEIARGEIVMARDRDEWTAEEPRHVFDEARLTATCRTFEHDGGAVKVSGLEKRYLVTDRQIEGGFGPRVTKSSQELRLGRGGRCGRLDGARFMSHHRVRQHASPHHASAGCASAGHDLNCRPRRGARMKKS
jgi:hypothetical protein